MRYLMNMDQTKRSMGWMCVSCIEVTYIVEFLRRNLCSFPSFRVIVATLPITCQFPPLLPLSNMFLVANNDDDAIYT